MYQGRGNPSGADISFLSIVNERLRGFAAAESSTQTHDYSVSHYSVTAT